MRALIRFGVERPVVMNLLFIGVVVYGLCVALPRLAVERYPNVDMGEAYVDTFWPGADPDDVERLVTRPVEESIRGMAGIEDVRSISTVGHSQVHVKLADDQDHDRLFDRVRLAVQGAQGLLPSRDGKPLVPHAWKVEVAAWMPVLQASVVASDHGPAAGPRQLALLADELRVALERVPGVERVVVDGARDEQFAVELDPERLERHRVTLEAATAALAAGGRSLPAGSMASGGGERFVRVDGRYRSREDVLAVVVRRDGDGALLRIGDLVGGGVAGIEAVDRGEGGVHGGLRVSVDGRDAVSCKVLKQATADALSMRRALLAVVDGFRARRADEGIDVRVSMDSAVRIKEDVGVLGANLAQGAVLVVIALVILLSWRSAVLALSGQLFALLATVVVFQLLGYSLNQITLLGLMLIEGVLVDDAIVVCDNIHRHRERGLPLHEAVVEGVTEVFWPLVNGTATIVIGFLPLLMLEGSVGQFFRLIPITVGIAMGASLFECLLLLPLHAVDLEHWTGRDGGLARKAAAASGDPRDGRGAFAAFARAYDRCLRWTIGHPRATLGGVLALVLVAAGLLAQARWAADLGMRPIMRLALFPDDIRVLNVRVRMPPGTTLERTDSLLRRISADLVARGPQQIAGAVASAGMILDRDYRPLFGHEFGTIVAELPALAERDFADAKQAIARLRAELTERYAHDGVELAVGAQQDGFPTGRPLYARVLGRDDGQVQQLAADLVDWLHGEAGAGRLRGLIDIEDDQRLRLERLSFDVDRERAARAGVGEDRVAAFIAAAVDGAYVADFRRGDGDVPLRVRLSAAAAGDPARLARVPIVDEAPARVVRFADVGSISSSTAPAILARSDYQRCVAITGELAEDAAITRATIRDAVERWYRIHAAAYPGASVAFGGDAGSADRSFATLAVSFAAALFLVYACLAAQFRSYVQPLAIITNGLFAAIGVVLTVGACGVATWLLPEGWVRPERSLFTLPCMIAIVGLTGMVVNEDIVLMDFINARRAEGMALREALLLAAQQRLRAVLLTSVTTVAGLASTAIGMPYSIAWSPMATCFVAGIVVSGAMTMLALPVIYECLDRWTTRAAGTVDAAMEETDAPDAEASATGDAAAEADEADAGVVPASATPPGWRRDARRRARQARSAPPAEQPEPAVADVADEDLLIVVVEEDAAEREGGWHALAATAN